MFGLALTLLTLAMAFVAARMPLRVGFVMLLASVVLVPGSTTMPNGVTSLLAVHRVVLIGLLIGVLIRPELRSRLRPTPTSFAFVLYLLIVLVTGVLLASAALSFNDELHSFLGLLEQAVALLACTAIAREDPDPVWYLWPFAVILTISVSIGVAEHLTGGNYARWLFSHLPAQRSSAAASNLAVRAGDQRIRAGNDYPLGFAWVSAAMLPSVIIVGMRLNRRFALAALIISGLTLAAIYWSFSRSVILGLAIGFVITALVARDFRVTAIVCAVLAVGLAAFVAGPVLSHHFSSSVDQGSFDVRQQRIPLVLNAVADRPWTGLGLSGLKLLALQGTDATYLLSYGETGAAGLAGLVGLLCIALVGVGRGLFATETRLRLGAAAMLAGAATLVAAGGAYDAMTLPDTAVLLWMMVGVGIAIAERAQGSVSLRAVPSLFPPFVGLAAVAGSFLVLAAPAHDAQEFRFTTLPVIREESTYNPAQTGSQLIDTTCAAIDAQAHLLPGVHASCRDVFTGPGVGELRIEANTPERITAATAAFERVARKAGVVDLHLYAITGIVRGRPTAATTAPLWLAIAVVMLLFGASGRLMSYGTSRRRRMA